MDQRRRRLIHLPFIGKARPLRRAFLSVGAFGIAGTRFCHAAWLSLSEKRGKRDDWSRQVNRLHRQ
jgi:hypothetical protein